MRILYHHRTRATDAQRVHIREMIQAFRRLGHQVEQAALADAEKPRNDAKHEAGHGIVKEIIRRIPFISEIVQLAYNVFALPWLLWKIHARNIDFIYERYALSNFAGVVAARLSGRPLVLEVNSPLALELEREGEIRGARLAHWMERWICNMAARVIVVSGPLKRILMANGVREEKLLLMPNGVNLDHISHAPDTAVLRKQLALEGCVTIGFVGWFRKWHGLELLLEAFHQAGLARRKTKLLLVGDGPAMAELREYAAANQLEDAVIFAGPVPHENIASYLHLIDIAVQPAANEYCCPMKIIEYMGLGKPVIAPKQENMEELLAHREQALLFTPRDAGELSEAMCTLVENAVLRNELGRQSLQTIHRRGLLWSRNAERIVELITARSQPSPQPGWAGRRRQC
jgi:glycosyltransferase involved in cell wall biosynthesis